MSLSAENIKDYAGAVTRPQPKVPQKSYSLLIFDIDATILPTYDTFLTLIFLSKRMAESDLGQKLVTEETQKRDQRSSFRTMLEELFDEKTPLVFDWKAMDSLLSRREKALFFEMLNLIESKPRLVSYLFHRPEKALQIIEQRLLTERLTNSKEYALLNDKQKEEAVKNVRQNCNSHLDKDIQACIESSFQAYPGMRKVLDKCKETGTKVCFYTNSRAEHIIGTGIKPDNGRLQRAGITPSDVDALYFRIDSFEEGKAWLARNKNNPFVMDGKVNFYTKRKPNFLPIKHMMDKYEVPSENVLYIGESCHDLECVLPDSGRLEMGEGLKVDFAYQKRGAIHAERAVHINNRVRKHALGHADFETKYPEAEKHPNIWILEKGIQSFVNMIDKAIHLTAPCINFESDPQDLTRPSGLRPTSSSALIP